MSYSDQIDYQRQRDAERNARIDRELQGNRERGQYNQFQRDNQGFGGAFMSSSGGSSLFFKLLICGVIIWLVWQVFPAHIAQGIQILIIGLLGLYLFLKHWKLALLGAPAFAAYKWSGSSQPPAAQKPAIAQAAPPKAAQPHLRKRRAVAKPVQAAIEAEK